MFTFLFFNNFNLKELTINDIIATVSIILVIHLLMIIYIFVNEGNMKEVLSEEKHKNEHKQYKQMFNCL